MNEKQLSKLVNDARLEKVWNFCVYVQGERTWVGDGVGLFAVPSAWLPEPDEQALVQGQAIVPAILTLGRLAQDEADYSEVLGLLDGGQVKRLGPAKERAKRGYRLRRCEPSFPVVAFDKQGRAEALVLPLSEPQARYCNPAPLRLRQVEPLSPLVLLQREREVLGTFVSGHPLALVEQPREVTHYLAELGDEMDGERATVLGYITKVERRMTKGGQRFVIAELEDLTGVVEVVVWPRALAGTRDVWQEGAIVCTRVKVESREDRLGLSVQGARGVLV